MLGEMMVDIACTMMHERPSSGLCHSTVWKLQIHQVNVAHHKHFSKSELQKAKGR